MYEIFGSEEVVSFKKNTNIKQTGVFGSVKGELNKRSVGVGSSKKVLGDVSNKVKNVLQQEPRLHLRSISPSKSSKKLLFPEDIAAPEKERKNLCIGQSVKQLKSPTKRIPLSPKSNDGVTKCFVHSVKKTKSPQHITPLSLKLNNRPKKIPIFVESDSENEIGIEKDMLSDEMDDVFASPIADGNQAYNLSDLEEQPQAIHGYCSGYDTPEEDADGWLMEPLWNNKKELERITNVHQSLESVREMSDNEQLAVPDDIFAANVFVDDTCIIPLSYDVPIPDVEW